MSVSTAIYLAEGITALVAVVGTYIAYRSRKKEHRSESPRK